MDIQGWLETTADRAPPDASSDDHRFPAAARQQERPAEVSTRRYRHKRQRASSDSSIVVPRKPGHLRATASYQGPSANLAPVVGGAGDTRSEAESRSSNASKRHLAGADKAGEISYERRPRHKTKPDRYEPKRKQHKKDQDVRRDSKAKRRKSTLTHDGSRTTGLVQSFQLKTGSKNSRLTLKPDLNAGLFKHGRASAQMTGRGTGLPDLVFNEMRFLEKPSEHQNEAPAARFPPGSKKEDRKRTTNEEISGYFAAPEKSVQHIDASEQHAERVLIRHSSNSDQEAPRTKQRGPASIADLPAKPFLGFGSRAAQLESKESRIETDTSFSWSESAPRRSPQPASHARRQTAQLFSSRRIEGARHQSTFAALRREADQLHRSSGRQHSHANDVQVSQLRLHSYSGHWRQSQRTAHAAVEETEPSDRNQPKQPPLRTSPTRTTLQSLPRHPDFQASGDELQEHPDDRSPFAHHDYRTSDILRVHDQIQQPGCGTPWEGVGTRRSGLSDKENENPEHPNSSFPLDRVLLQVREAVSKPDVATVYHFEPPKRQSRYTYDRRASVRPQMQGDLDLPVDERRQRTMTVLPSAELRQEYQEPRPPSEHLQPPRKQSSHRETPRLTAMPQRGVKPVFAPAPTSHRPSPTLDDDEMLDNGQEYDPGLLEAPPVYATEQQVHDLVHRSMSVPRPSIFEAQAERESQEPSLHWLTSEHNHSERDPSRTLLMDSDMLHEEVTERRQGDVDDGIAGFWKPHKLY